MKQADQANASVPLFQQKWLNKLTRSHVSIPVGMVLSFSLFMLYWSFQYTSLGIGVTALLFFTGLLFFTLVEYLIHRNLYHIEPKTEGRKRFSYVVHGVHHDYPRDKYRIAMPPAGIVVYLVLFFAVFRIVLGPTYSYATLSGFTLGYCAYQFVHYSVHIFRPPNNFLKALWTNHAIHHHKDDTVLYGVSSPLWDYVFGTLPKRETGLKNVEVKAP